MNERRVLLRDGRCGSIRPLTPADVDLLYRCFQGFSPETRRLFAPHPFSYEVAEDLCSSVDVDTSALRFIVHEERRPSMPLGYGLLFHWSQEVPTLGIGLVDTAAGLGLGRQVMLFLLKRAREAGRPGVRLTVMERNARARRLYESLGFCYYNGRSWDSNGNGWSLKMEVTI